jgi:hypothetical protein
MKMRKNKTTLIIIVSIVSFLFAFVGCTSADNQIESVPMGNVAQEEIVEEVKEEPQEIVEEVEEETQEEIQEEPVEEAKEEVVEEAKVESTEEVAEEKPQEEAVADETPQEEAVVEEASQEEKEEEKVEEQVVENKPVEEPIKEEPKEEYHWILNTNTKKVHIPTCNSVKQMKEKNKKESDLSPEELKSKGYTACKNCNPFK